MRQGKVNPYSPLALILPACTKISFSFSFPSSDVFGTLPNKKKLKSGTQ